MKLPQRESERCGPGAGAGALARSPNAAFQEATECRASTTTLRQREISASERCRLASNWRWSLKFSQKPIQTLLS